MSGSTTSPGTAGTTGIVRDDDKPRKSGMSATDILRSVFFRTTPAEGKPILVETAIDIIGKQTLPIIQEPATTQQLPTTISCPSSVTAAAAALVIGAGDTVDESLATVLPISDDTDMKMANSVS
ncbi:hypothetical protein CBL_04867 [Carabus blaptoides fortunei]